MNEPSVDKRMVFGRLFLEKLGMLMEISKAKGIPTEPITTMIERNLDDYIEQNRNLVKDEDGVKRWADEQRAEAIAKRLRQREARKKTYLETRFNR